MRMTNIPRMLYFLERALSKPKCILDSLFHLINQSQIALLGAAFHEEVVNEIGRKETNKMKKENVTQYYRLLDEAAQKYYEERFKKIKEREERFFHNGNRI